MCIAPHAHPSIFMEVQHAEGGFADAHRVLQHGLEHRLQLAGRLEITCSTSEVAVCCSNASESSRVRACTSSNSRAFSIAITAWSAKVVSSSICLSVNGLTSVRCKPMAPIGTPSRRSGAPNKVLKRAIFCASPSSYSGSASDVGDLDRLAFQRGPSNQRRAPR